MNRKQSLKQKVPCSPSKIIANIQSSTTQENRARQHRQNNIVEQENGRLREKKKNGGNSLSPNKNYNGEKEEIVAKSDSLGSLKSKNLREDEVKL